MLNDQLSKMMQQAKKIQDDMSRVQGELEAKSFTGTAGGGIASATVNGKMEITGLKIMPEAVDPEDVEMLEDVILAAVKEAQKNAASARDKEMSALTGGIRIPGMF